jgi:hypothetical protein
LAEAVITEIDKKIVNKKKMNSKWERLLYIAYYIPTSLDSRSLLTTCWDKLHGNDVIPAKAGIQQ